MRHSPPLSRPVQNKKQNEHTHHITSHRGSSLALHSSAAERRTGQLCTQKGQFRRHDQESRDQNSLPVFPDDNKEAARIAARIIERSAKFDELEGQLKTDKAELKMLVAPHYFTINHGKGEIPSSIAVNSPSGEVLVCFQNRYSKLPDEEPLAAVLDAEHIAKYFQQTFEIKISGAKLPQDPEVCQTLMNELQELFARHQASDALEASEGIAPKKNFHEDRHRELSVSQNLALEQICPMIAMVKTKGRK